MQFGNCMYEVNGNLTCKTVEHADNTIAVPTTAVPTIDASIRKQGVCNVGYYDKTNGKPNWWACGENCPGGKYWTDGLCNCACLPLAIQGVCKVGYYDKTYGKANWRRECGANCKGGKNWTDGSCNCACLPRGPCNEGYYDKTDGKAKWWECGANCPGGKNWTDDLCNCACLPVP
jgi:hypothetical protein